MANNEKMSRRLIDVERVQSMTDGMQVFVNNNGAVQQIPANEVGGSGLPEGAAANRQ